LPTLALMAPSAGRSSPMDRLTGGIPPISCTCWLSPSHSGSLAGSSSLQPSTSFLIQALFSAPASVSLLHRPLHTHERPCMDPKWPRNSALGWPIFLRQPSWPRLKPT
jgi:hypothetical protein